MTVQLLGVINSYQGLSTDVKPTGSAITITPGSVFRELDTGVEYRYDGTSWNRQMVGFSLSSRILLTVATSAASFSTSLNLAGKGLVGYFAEVGNGGGTSQIRTFSVQSSAGVTVWSTTMVWATAGSSGSTFGGVSPTVVLDGAYTIALSLSTYVTSACTDAIQLCFQNR